MSDANQTNEIFSTLEIDTIGEIMNISMGSAATAASTLLDSKVTITTPIVKVVSMDEFHIAELIPAIAVEIKYVEGISGSNILILKAEDVRKILGQMMMTEIPDDFVIDEMAESAICELMNQMMGSSATVLSCFLGRSINISTPNALPIEGLDDFKKEHFGDNPNILTISFDLVIEGIMDSQFVCAMQIDLAKEIIDVSLNFDTETDTQEEEKTFPEPQQTPAAPPPPPQQQQPYPDQQQQYAPPPQQQYAPPPQYQQQPQYQYAPPPPAYGYPPPQSADPIMVRDYSFNDFVANPNLTPDQQTNLDLVMKVPVVVTVELGRTKRKIKEILEFGQGTIVELDKQAGSQVDIIVNGQMIAKGDVVVVDDNFSIRITEILKNRDALSLL